MGHCFCLQIASLKSTSKTSQLQQQATLKRVPDRKGEGGQKKGPEVASAEFRADEVENDNGLIGLEEEEYASSDSFNEM